MLPLSLQTPLQNGLTISDVPGPTGGIMIKSTTGAMLIVNDTGIYIQNGKGALPLDADRYREKSYAIFRVFAKSMGADPDLMVDHLKDIPGQMVGIVKDDPEVLDSYDNFVVALMGPQ